MRLKIFIRMVTFFVLFLSLTLYGYSGGGGDNRGGGIVGGGGGGDSGGGGDGDGDSEPPGPNGLIESLKALNIDKHIGITYNERLPNPSDPEWDIYYYDETDCKCIYGDEYVLYAREKPDQSNVIFMMSGGGIC